MTTIDIEGLNSCKGQHATLESLNALCVYVHLYKLSSLMK